MKTQEFVIRRTIEIDSGHRIPDHGSKCKNVHGHRYKIEAVVAGPVQTEGKESGMIMDFSFIKEIMMKEIHEPCDHAMIWFKDDPLYNTLFVEHPDHRVAQIGGWKNYVIDCVPTAENLAMHWFNRIHKGMSKWFGDSPHAAYIKLIQVNVHETPNCMASYPYDAPATQVRSGGPL